MRHTIKLALVFILLLGILILAGIGSYYSLKESTIEFTAKEKAKIEMFGKRQFRMPFSTIQKFKDFPEFKAYLDSIVDAEELKHLPKLYIKDMRHL